MSEGYGILRYGALAQRIGRPEEKPPRALDRVWNLDMLETTESDYLEAVRRIRAIYTMAYPDVGNKAREDDLVRSMSEVIKFHPEFSHVSTWRIVVTSAIQYLDSIEQGRPLPTPEELHDGVMEQLREG
jgi:hypothetical protein